MGGTFPPPLFSAVSLGFAIPLFILALRREQGLVLPRLHALTGEMVRAVWWLRAQVLGRSCRGGSWWEAVKVTGFLLSVHLCRGE